MAKKARRSRKTGTTNKTAEPQQTAEERFQQQYAYVVKDLRQILILAAAMFILLIALNILLQ